MTPIEPGGENVSAAETTIALATIQIDAIRKLQDYIRTRNPTDLSESGDVFAQLIAAAVLRGVLKSEIAAEFGVNKSTVSRWAAGQNLPQTYIRPHVIKWMVERLDLMAAHFERERDLAQLQLRNAGRLRQQRP